MFNHVFRREMVALRAELSDKIEANIASLNVRFDGYDKATELFDANLNRIPTATDRAVLQLKELHDETFVSVDEKIKDNRILSDERFTSAEASTAANRSLSDEKFIGIQKQFIERDTRVEQSARDTKVAVDAALQAAEKAVGKQNESFALSIAKSENATTKQIDQQASTLQAAANALESKIGDLKDRVGRIENTAVNLAQGETRVTTQKSIGATNNNLVVSIIVAIVAVAALVSPHLTLR